MTPDTSLEHLLRWRLALAEADAPPPPRAAQLLALAQPWWERWPNRLRVRMEQLRRMPAALGYAMSMERDERRGHPVATILALSEDLEAQVRVLYLSIQDGRLRLRFQLDRADVTDAEVLEATFLVEGDSAPFAGHARRTPNGEYRLDVELPELHASAWSALTVTERMPFRLVLCPEDDRS
jgi:hypothetical protein